MPKVVQRQNSVAILLSALAALANFGYIPNVCSHICIACCLDLHDFRRPDCFSTISAIMSGFLKLGHYKRVGKRLESIAPANCCCRFVQQDKGTGYRDTQCVNDTQSKGKHKECAINNQLSSVFVAQQFGKINGKKDDKGENQQKHSRFHSLMQTEFGKSCFSLDSFFLFSGLAYALLQPLT